MAWPLVTLLVGASIGIRRTFRPITHKFA
ncbi:TPA: hypothetical protein SLN76_000523 [Morganella morganii]|nr:hypothetical protein [Morganella morganii]